tara:strand:- start:1435 stop:1806 length:372 start_codon:yes stop_codon:yes gene_type:complete
MKLITPDYIAIVAFLLLVSAHITTNYLITAYGNIAEDIGVAEEVAIMFEANPIAKSFFRLEGLKKIYSVIIMPSIFFTVYYYHRRKHINNPEFLESVSILLLLLSFLNATNDLSILLGFLAST